ncbi:hypothetical protein B0H11DRAFT_1923115 [Mycena galericulata]|nr:hypothetical protein B0H11DRAFT_1923115 [Mycena galericulata]
MRTSNSVIDPILLESESPPRGPSSRGAGKLSETVKASRRRACEKYRSKCAWMTVRTSNALELREKARIRMAERRRAIKEDDLLLSEDAARVKRDGEIYRAKHRSLLAFKARARRQRAFIEKHGEQAYLERSTDSLREPGPGASDAEMDAYINAKRTRAKAHRAQALRYASVQF